MAKWIQKAVKRPGRFEGKTQADLKKTVARLRKKADAGTLSKEDQSLLKAAALGVRFKSKEFRKKKK